MTLPTSSADHFRSRLFPEQNTLAEVFAHELFRPLMVCLAPVLIASLVHVLFGRPALELALRGSVAALGLSGMWTYYQLNRRLVEVRFREDRVAMVSAWKAAQATPPLAWERMLDLRNAERGIRVIVGHTTYEMARADWPDLAQIADRLRATQPGHTPGAS